jgi:amino acid transporter
VPERLGPREFGGRQVSRATLARRTLGSSALFVFSVGASSPLSVLAGGVVATYAHTGVVGVPLSFLVMMVLLGLLAVGYVAMSRRVVHSAPFYAQMSRGVNPSFGVAAAAVALLGYNTIQISLFGLIGTTMSGQVGGAWWVWAIAAWVIVAILGQFRGAANAKVLGSLLAVEIATIVLFDIAAFSNPAGGVVSAAPLLPSNLLVVGASGALAFAMAAFTGVESPPAFGEEARSPKVMAVATFSGVSFLGLFYAVSSWAYAVAEGPDQVVQAAGDPNRGPFSVLGHVFGSGMVTLATLLLVTSGLAAMSAFHSTVARYVFALAREHVLPASWAKVSTGKNGGAPLGGSILQSLVAAAVVGGFMTAGADPLNTMFVWLSTIGAVCILVLLTASSLASMAFFTAGGGVRESVFIRKVIPSAGGVVGVLVTVFMVANLSALLGTPPGSQLPLLVPLMVVGVGLIGLLWGSWLRRARPEVYDELGKGAPDPLTVLDQRLADLAV